MTKELIEHARKRHTLTDLVLLILTVALVLSLAIAATVVSIGMARADTLGAIASSNGERLAWAMFLCFVIAGIGGVTALVVRDGERPQRRN